MNYKADNVEDTLCIFRYRVYNRKGETYKTYIAQIVGEDPTFILKRDFLFPYVSGNSRFRTFTHVLEDGIYELMVKRFDEETGDCLEKDRRWLVVSDGELRLYDNEEMNYQYVLYVASSLFGGAA